MWRLGIVALIAAAIFVAVYVAVLPLRRRAPACREFAADGAAVELGAGLGIGLVLFSAVVAVIARSAGIA